MKAQTNLQKNAATSHISSTGVVLGGRSNQDIDKENELAKKKNKPLVPTSGKPLPRKNLVKLKLIKRLKVKRRRMGPRWKSQRWRGPRNIIGIQKMDGKTTEGTIYCRTERE